MIIGLQLLNEGSRACDRGGLPTWDVSPHDTGCINIHEDTYSEANPLKMRPVSSFSCRPEARLCSKMVNAWSTTVLQRPLRSPTCVASFPKTVRLEQGRMVSNNCQCAGSQGRGAHLAWQHLAVLLRHGLGGVLAKLGHAVPGVQPRHDGVVLLGYHGRVTPHRLSPGPRWLQINVVSDHRNGEVKRQHWGLRYGAAHAKGGALAGRPPCAALDLCHVVLTCADPHTFGARKPSRLCQRVREGDITEQRPS